MGRLVFDAGSARVEIVDRRTVRIFVGRARDDARTAAIRHYIDPSSDHHAPKLNSALRSGSVTREQHSVAEHLDSAIHASTPHKRPVTLYRGAPSEHLAHAEHQRGFTSASLDPHTASSYAGPKGTIYKIHVPAGARTLDTGPHDHLQGGAESEHVLPRFGRFLHRDQTSRGPEGQRVVHVDWEPPEGGWAKDWYGPKIRDRREKL